MRYLLALLTCGRPEYARRVLRQYQCYLDPPPSALYVWDDGLTTPRETFDIWPGVHAEIDGGPALLGRCAAHANLWRRAAVADYDWVFAIEDDILLLRPADLRAMRNLLLAEPTLQQVALVRCPWGSEIPFGGYIPMRDEMNLWWYERRETVVNGRRLEWVASCFDWTNSPALFHASLPRAVCWPEAAGCEGELGPRVLERFPDSVSGYWGWGEPWVAHIGVERVRGAHGY